MESVRDLNMDADEMQVVLSAIRSVNKRIKEVAQTHKPLFGGEHFLTTPIRFKKRSFMSFLNRTRILSALT